ncbi:MAG: hypothetical protein R3F65_11930 [bacterium]
MQIAFAASAYDDLAYARRSWRRDCIGTPPIRVNYYFCGALPKWAAQLIALAMASTRLRGSSTCRKRSRTRRGSIGSARRSGTLTHSGSPMLALRWSRTGTA